MASSKPKSETEEEPSFSSPTPIPLPISTPSPTPVPTETPTPKPTATPTPKPAPSLTSTPLSTPSAIPTLKPQPTSAASTNPPPSHSFAPSPKEEAGKKNGFSLEGRVPELQGLEFSGPSSAPIGPPPEVSPPETSPRPKPQTTLVPSISASPGQIDEALKRLMIVELKKQTESVLVEVSVATGDFREIKQLDKVQALPASVSTNVTLLGNASHDFREKVGYEVAYYECLNEIETVDALVLVDEITRDLAAKDAPSARNILASFIKRSSKPTADSLKPVWAYLNSTFSILDRLKNQAATHLGKAQSLESAGKKNEALAEYREIYRIYPNPITADKIKQFESKSR
jgi:hypothetical protein